MNERINHALSLDLLMEQYNVFQKNKYEPRDKAHQDISQFISAKFQNRVKNIIKKKGDQRVMMSELSQIFKQANDDDKDSKFENS